MTTAPSPDVSPLSASVTTLESAEAQARPERAALRVTLIQARNADDPARTHEHACFAARMGLRPDQVHCVSIFEADLASLDLSATDAILVGGAGQYSVLDRLPAVEAFVAFVAGVATRPDTATLPMFASCFGFQALVKGLGGTVIEDAAHAEVGSYTLTCAPAAADDPVFRSLPPQFIAQLGHKDRADALPPGLIDLASSERAPFQAVRVVGRPQLATQFHPELNHADNRSRFLRYMPEYGKLFGAEAAQERLASHRPGVASNALLDDFTELFVVPRHQQRGVHP